MFVIKTWSDERMGQKLTVTKCPGLWVIEYLLPSICAYTFSICSCKYILINRCISCFDIHALSSTLRTLYS